MFEHAAWASSARKSQAKELDRVANAVRRTRHRRRNPRNAHNLARDLVQLTSSSGTATRAALHMMGWTDAELDQFGPAARSMAVRRLPTLLDGAL